MQLCPSLHAVDQPRIEFLFPHGVNVDQPSDITERGSTPTCQQTSVTSLWEGGRWEHKMPGYSLKYVRGDSIDPNSFTRLSLLHPGEII